MKIKTVKRVLRLLALSAFLFSACQAQAADKEQLIKNVLKISGAEEQIQQIPAQVKFGFEQTGGQVPYDFFSKIMELIDLSYNATELYQKVYDHLAGQYDEKKFLDIQEKLKSPIAIKMTELENSASDISNYEELVAFVEGLQENPVDSERIPLVRRLNDATQATKMALEVAVLSQRIVMQAINNVLPDEQKVSDEQLKEFEDDFISQSEDLMNENIITTFLFAYREVSNQELEEYLKLIESENGQWFSKISNDAFISAMSDSTANFGKLLQIAFADLINENQGVQQELLEAPAE